MVLGLPRIRWDLMRRNDLRELFEMALQLNGRTKLPKCGMKIIIVTLILVLKNIENVEVYMGFMANVEKFGRGQK